MKAVVLLSGGLDSTVCLALAKQKGRECIALSFDYEQRHRVELDAAKEIAAHYQSEHRILKVDKAPLTSSALLGAEEGALNYVPARNTIFLAYATAVAESAQAEEIYFGANADDETEFCDCRPAYLEAWKTLLPLATNQGASKLIAPLLSLRKKDIIEKALELNVPFSLTQTCYNPPTGKIKHCGTCASCLLRKEGFIQAKVPDPTLYVST